MLNFPFFWVLGRGQGKRWPSFGDQLPPDEDVSTSKACGTVDFLIKIKFKSKFSPEITVEKDKSVAEIYDFNKEFFFRDAETPLHTFPKTYPR